MNWHLVFTADTIAGLITGTGAGFIIGAAFTLGVLWRKIFKKAKNDNQ